MQTYVIFLCVSVCVTKQQQASDKFPE